MSELETGRAPRDIRERLLSLLTRYSFRRGRFELASGKVSDYYIDCRVTTFSAEGAYLTGKAVYASIAGSGAQAVGGLTMGADPIATAVAIESFVQGNPIPAFFVRKEPKGHGTMRQIEGPLVEGAPVAIVDDVITTGGSVFKAIEAVEAAGSKVSRVVVLVDRLEGGGDELRRRGYDFAPLFTIKDFGV